MELECTLTHLIYAGVVGCFEHSIHQRTVKETDIVNFEKVSGDHFYANFDKIAAKDSLFEKRIFHGYFVLSATMFPLLIEQP